MELIGVSWKMLYNIDYMDEIKDPFNKDHKASHDKILQWRKDVFLFCDEMLDMKPAEPLDELKGKTIKYENTYGEKKEALLFDTGGRLVWHDLGFYSKDMFKWQERKEFNAHPNMFTWQQTVELEAYDRGINTFDKDSYDPRARRITIRSGHGIGKVQNNSLFVATPKGKVKWGDIKVGDYLFGANGKPTKVQEKFVHKDWDFYKITFDDGSYSYCGKEHLWNVRGRKERRNGLSGWRTMSLEDIISAGVKRSNGDVMTNQWEIPTTQPVQFKEKEVKIDPYLYGAFLGDGSKGTNQFSSGVEDWEHWVGSWSKHHKLGVKRKGKYFSILDFTTSNKYYGEQKTNNLRVQNDYKYNSVDVRLAVLQGLLDTDGNAGSNSRAEFVSISEQLVDDVIWLARSLGLKAIKGKIKKPFYYKGKIKIFGQLAYRCNIAFNGVDLFRIERKQTRLTKNEARYTTRWIEKIEYSHKEDGHCVVVDSADNLYLTNDFIVTHNTSFASVVSIHFLWCFYFAQIGATANTDTQLKEIFLKEFYWWKKRLPEQVQDQLEELNDKIQIKGSKKNWFLRARVAGKDNPEALAGLHGNYVMLYPDEASGIWDKVYETMQGSLTGENWIVILTSNPTRTEGYFYDTHKKMNSHMWTQLHFDSRDSPIVKDDFVQGIIDQYGEHGDEFKVRVKGEFANEGEMDDKGWIPLFANMNILFEEAGQQIIKGAVIGVDPAGQGKDRSIITVRDNIYLKEVLNESTSSEPDLARKVETIVGAYSSTLNDVGIDAFGIGAKVINHIHTKIGEMPNALLCDKPREEVKDQYNSYKAELAWKFRQWVAQGGIIVTNNEKEWLRELSLIKYKRDLQGRIKLMSKVEFKKEHGFSPDRFDACCYTFFRDEPTRPVILTKEEIENKDWADYIKRMQGGNATSMRDLSSM